MCGVTRPADSNSTSSPRSRLVSSGSDSVNERISKKSGHATYQPGQVVSKTLAQNDAVSVTLFAFDKDEEIQAGAPVWLCAPPDPVSADADGNQMAFRGRVLDPAFDDQGLVSLEIYEGDGNISNVSVPAYYLYAREEDGVYSEATAPKE